jgi:hypothetical protein
MVNTDNTQLHSEVMMTVRDSVMLLVLCSCQWSYDIQNIEKIQQLMIGEKRHQEQQSACKRIQFHKQKLAYVLKNGYQFVYLL